MQQPLQASLQQPGLRRTVVSASGGSHADQYASPPSAVARSQGLASSSIPNFPSVHASPAHLTPSPPGCGSCPAVPTPPRGSFRAASERAAPGPHLRPVWATATTPYRAPGPGASPSQPQLHLRGRLPSISGFLGMTRGLPPFAHAPTGVEQALPSLAEAVTAPPPIISLLDDDL